MGWAVWLAVSIGTTVLAALATWARGWVERRGDRPLSTDAAMRAHQRYLDALAAPARGTERVSPAAGGSLTVPD